MRYTNVFSGQRSWLALLLVAVVLLSACQAKPTPPVAVEPTIASTSEAIAQPAETIEVPTAAPDAHAMPCTLKSAG